MENFNKAIEGMQAKVSMVAVVDRDLNNFKQEFQQKLQKQTDSLQANNLSEKND